MKKLVLFVLAGLMTIGLTSCSSNSPRDVAEKAMKCAQKNDIRGYLDLVYFPESDKDQKEGYAQMAEEKLQKNKDDSQAIDSYKFVEENVNEEAGTATVTFDVTYKNGDSRETPVDMIRDENGQWWIKMNK